MMRSLERNKIPFYYALYKGMAPVLDDQGNDTGQTAPSYYNPVKTRQRVSPNKGEANTEAFGITTAYDRVITTTDKLPLTETSVLYIDAMPVLESDGSTTTSADYKVVKAAKDINVCSYAIQKITN